MTLYRPTTIEIDLGAIAQNVRVVRKRIPESARLMAVVKADGYGHGAAQAARAAVENGAEQLAVAIPEEGAALRKSGIGAPVLVLGGITKEGAEAAAKYKLSQTVFDTKTVKWLESAAARYRTALDVHIKIDSGMNRIGVRDERELTALAHAVLSAKRLRLAGVYTHFATADEQDLSFTKAQAEKFESLVGKLRAMKPDLIAHAANSAAVFRCPEYAYDMVRVGIALYGCASFSRAETGLREAIRWTTRAAHIKEIAPGETVSYGRLFRAERATRVMTIPVGYADGYHRCIGGVGRALVRGKSVPVIGRVCMDQTMLDVTDIPDADVGDEVALLGCQGEEKITVSEMGKWCNMIDYEVLLSPTARVPRLYKNDAH